MTESEESVLVSRYRISVEDVSTPLLDATIMAAARREAAKRRFIRRSTLAFIASTMIGTFAHWHPHSEPIMQPTPTATNYGALEDISRPYLLQMGKHLESGPGALERTQP